MNKAQTRYSNWLSLSLFFGLGLFTSTPAALAQDPPLGEIIDEVHCGESGDKRYALYLPSAYSPERKWPILLLFEPVSRAPLPLGLFKDAAERYGFILACTYDTPNYRPWEVNWPGAHAMWTDLLARFSIDSRRMYAGGFSGGARFASRVAFHTEQIQAVVLCGAGFWVRNSQAPKPNFEVVSTVGVTDFNFLELAELKDELTGLGIPNRGIMFLGGHSWPGSDHCDAALGWLQIRAFRKGLIPVEEVLAAWQIEQGLKEAQSFEASGRIVLAHDRYQRIVEDFQGIADLGQAAERVARIEQDKAYKAKLKEWEKAERKEQRLRVEYASRLAHGLNMAGNDPMSLRGELLWWKREISKLFALQNKPKNIPEKEAGDRLFSTLSAKFYEQNIYYFQERAFDKAFYLTRLSQILTPDSPNPDYNFACIHAGKGEIDEAFAALERAVAKGARRADRFRAEPLFEPLKGDPRFQVILEKLEQNRKTAAEKRASDQ